MTLKKNIDLEEKWKLLLSEEFQKPYMAELRKFLREEKAQGKVIFPKGKDIFKSFNLTPFDQVKVVMIGQDPYHGPNQAHGLCFSVPEGIKPPPSLMNIYKELHRDLNLSNGPSGNLENWAKQGVLLLNSVLTVEQSKAASHSGKGWEQFTDKVIDVLNEHREGLVFMLWGKYAQEKGKRIDRKKHKVLMTSHPSPFSVYRGFLGSSHFSQANQFFKEKSQAEINWQA